MTIAEMEHTAHELKELKRMQEELTTEIIALEDALKTAMGDSERFTAGVYRITYKTVQTARVDTTALREALPEVAARFLKTSTARRFCVN